MYSMIFTFTIKTSNQSILFLVLEQTADILLKWPSYHQAEEHRKNLTKTITATVTTITTVITSKINNLR